MRTEIEERAGKLRVAILRKQPDVIRQVIGDCPALVADYIPGDAECTWMNKAAASRTHEGTIEVMAALLSLGFSPNALRLPEKSSALSTAIGFDNYDLAKFLLEHGADPNLGQPLISAINCDDRKLAM